MIGRNLQTAELLYLLVLKELKVRYKRSVLGYLWAIANPFAFAFVYWVAFKFIMRVQMENYTVFILTGMFPWAWLSQAAIQGTGSFTNNLSLVRHVKLPKLILPCSNVLQEMAHFVLAIPVVFVFIALSSEQIHAVPLLWQLPMMLVLQAFFVFPITVIGAVLNVYVRDIQYLVGIMFSVFFFVTPMVYPLSMVPVEYRAYFKLNPAYWLIDSWRIVFAGDVLPLGHIASVIGWILAFSLVAAWVYRRLAGRIAELI
ncbi:ABC transporter permease [Bradyrhizobium sp.]|uniref:ABC transporter permease n=1 Tax=Bradyrhizobium sp. TaxID=376 RepID=UPI0026247563|nr:ABC transporter permease [Bradyrhizobium sp.]